MNPDPIDLTDSALFAEPPVIQLRGRSLDDRQEIVPVLLDTMAGCGCWLLDRRELPPNTTQLNFELQLRSVFELYSGLLACGLDLSRDSHIRMKSLCMVRDHNPHRARRRRILTIRLELVFSTDVDAVKNLARIATGLA
jgi:hypothetical protein